MQGMNLSSLDKFEGTTLFKGKAFKNKAFKNKVFKKIAVIVLLVIYEALFLILLIASLYPNLPSGSPVPVAKLLNHPIGHIVVNETVILLALALFLPVILPFLSKIKFGGAEIELVDRLNSVEGQVSEIDGNVKAVEKQSEMSLNRHDAALFTIATSLSQHLFVNQSTQQKDKNALNSLTFGQMDFTESWLMTQIVVQGLHEKTRIEQVPLLINEPDTDENTLMTFFRLITGKTDLFLWYSGTGMMLADGSFQGIDVDNPEAVREALNALYQPLGLTWLPQIGFQDSELLVMLKAKAEAFSIQNMADLKQAAPLLSFGANREFFLRDWYYPDLLRKGFQFQSVNDEIDLNDRMKGLYAGAFDVGVCMETAPEFLDPKIHVIQPTALFPRLPQYAMPVCRTELLENENVRHLLAQMPSISVDQMRKLLLSADHHGVTSSLHPTIKGLAADFLKTRSG